jgi:CrcB protein
LKEVLYVAIGGAVGSAGRYLVDRAIGERSFPVATLTVNLVGSFVLGLLVGWIGDRVAPGVRLALFTGVLGGFTTFSTFALEASVLLRSGHGASALSYLIASIAGGVVLAFAGLVAGESLA